MDRRPLVVSTAQLCLEQPFPPQEPCASYLRGPVRGRRKDKGRRLIWGGGQGGITGVSLFSSEQKQLPPLSTVTFSALLGKPSVGVACGRQPHQQLTFFEHLLWTSPLLGNGHCYFK